MRLFFPSRQGCGWRMLSYPIYRFPSHHIMSYPTANGSYTQTKHKTRQRMQKQHAHEMIHTELYMGARVFPRFVVRFPNACKYDGMQFAQIGLHLYIS